MYVIICGLYCMFMQLLCIMGKLSCACLNVQIHCKTEHVPVEQSSFGSCIFHKFTVFTVVNTIFFQKWWGTFFLKRNKCCKGKGKGIYIALLL